MQYVGNSKYLSIKKTYLPFDLPKNVGGILPNFYRLKSVGKLTSTRGTLFGSNVESTVAFRTAPGWRSL